MNIRTAMAHPQGYFIVNKGEVDEAEITLRNEGSDTDALRKWLRSNKAESWTPSPQEKLANARKVSIPRRDFCIALASAGVLKPEDAINAARGDWPKPMDAFLSYLDKEQAIGAQIEWAAATEIARMHPFVLSLGSWLSLSDAEMDALFGISQP